MEKPDHIDRMQSERGKLEEKIAAAQSFLDGPGNTMLDRIQQHQLNNQLDAMRLYVRILNQRIEYDLDVRQSEAEEKERVAATLEQADDDAIANES